MKSIELLAALLVVALGCAKSPSAPSNSTSAKTKALDARELNADQARNLEAELAKHPDDPAIRSKLVEYYFMSRLTSAEAKSAYREHALWIIKNRPDADIASTYCGFDPILDSEGYASAKQLWADQIKSSPKNAAILGNAAQFFLVSDRAQAEELLKRAAELEPNNPRWSDLLGHLYSLPFGSDSSNKALAELEKAQNVDSNSGSKASRLVDLAKAAYDSGDLDKAKQYAEEALKSGAADPNSWYYGNSIHHGNNILGRIALKKGQIKEADEYLLKAGQTPGSPQLDSFGPNMCLARDLLQAGEKETVVQYLIYCQTFWQMGGDRLEEWTKQVKDGKTPEFGANLWY